MTPVRIFAQIALPATLLFAGLTLSPSTSHAAGLSVFQPTPDSIFERRGRHDDADECAFDDRCATDTVPHTLNRG